ncbi:MAG: DUF6077 domain-containing protein [Eubacteriales bacterium]|nr:DUF6077 domain-containing protein [Eubacteriales bacterium]
MSFVLKFLLAAFWMVIMPTTAGVLFIKKDVNASWGESIMCGWIFMWALGEILILPMIYLNVTLKFLTILYGAIVLLVAALGMTNMILKRWIFSESGRILKKTSVWFWIALVLIVLQIVYATLNAHFDADDSFYIGTASTDMATNTVFFINPFTGAAYTELPSRYVLSPYPVLLAMLSSLSGGLHPATMAHTFYPLVFMMLAYVVVFLTGRRLFPKNIHSQGRYLLFIVVMIWFSAYSVYNRENFFMVRLWQGKATLAGVLMPIFLYLGLSLILAERERYPWILLMMAGLGACLTSTMAVIIAPVTIGTFGIIGAALQKSWKKLLFSFLCCIPCLVLGFVYMMIR